MTQPQAPSTADRVAAALQVYADAIRYGHTPTPNFISLHTAAMSPNMFFALADRTDAPITIVEPAEGQTFLPYARLELPFGAGILPTGVTSSAHATTTIKDDAMRRDIAAHNAECITEGEPA